MHCISLRRGLIGLRRGRAEAKLLVQARMDVAGAHLLPNLSLYATRGDREIPLDKSPLLIALYRWRIIGHVCTSCGPECQKFLGSNLSERISLITGINLGYLCDFDPQISTVSVAQRMSWASKRMTTKIEDEAYSLLGIFNVNMPLLYGERSKAFLRLQEEIIRRTTDQSIFAWRVPRYSTHRGLGSHRGFGLLASSPRLFFDSGDGVLVNSQVYLDRPFTWINNGIEFIVNIHTHEEPSGVPDKEITVLRLNCDIAQRDKEPFKPVCISLGPIAGTNSHFARVFSHDLGGRYDLHQLQNRGEQRFYVPTYLDRPFLVASR